MGFLESIGCSGTAPTNLGHSDGPHTLQGTRKTAIHVSASGPAFWASQVKAHNKPYLYAISHPYL